MPVEHLLLGSQIEAMSETQLAEPPAARASLPAAPAHKNRIIHALQSKGHVWVSWAMASMTPRP